MDNNDHIRVQVINVLQQETKNFYIKKNMGCSLQNARGRFDLHLSHRAHLKP